jgi:hypothetical protein
VPDINPFLLSKTFLAKSDFPKILLSPPLQRGGWEIIKITTAFPFFAGITDLFKTFPERGVGDENYS